MHERQVLVEKVDELRAKLSDKNLQFLPEYEARVRVLQAVCLLCGVNVAVTRTTAAMMLKYGSVLFPTRYHELPCMHAQEVIDHARVSRAVEVHQWF
jgi:hypothetical protein